jgi:hypothetical protein
VVGSKQQEVALLRTVDKSLCVCVCLGFFVYLAVCSEVSKNSFAKELLPKGMTRNSAPCNGSESVLVNHTKSRLWYQGDTVSRHVPPEETRTTLSSGSTRFVFSYWVVMKLRFLFTHILKTLHNSLGQETENKKDKCGPLKAVRPLLRGSNSFVNCYPVSSSSTWLVEYILYYAMNMCLTWR